MQRAHGYVKSWPNEIKQEALYLSEQIGIEEFCQKTTIHHPSLLQWKKQIATQNKATTTEENAVEHKIIRIVMQRQEILFKAMRVPIAIFINDKVEFKLYCKDLAVKIADKVIL